MSGRGRAVVGVAGSPAALAALVRAVEEARRSDVELVVVRAVTSLGAPLPVDAAEPTTIRVLRHGAAAVIERAFTTTGGAPYDVEVSRETPVGAPGLALVSIADRPDDLLIVGQDRHRALHRALHGSVSSYCASHAVCRVLVVPPPGTPEPVADGLTPDHGSRTLRALRRQLST
ncbi:MAG TPA: universal stress protein [Streptosporangiaceae bacterium]